VAYEYDVFFSYKRDPQSDDWHRTVKEKLEFLLRLELAQPNLSVFFDTEEISTGLNWKEKVAEATKKSKCLIGIWSPLYFQSKWCLSEWKSFRERELRWRCNVVVAASYHDGKHFPPDAQSKQVMDFSNFTSTMAGFWSTTRAVDFEPMLKKFAADAAIIIRAAPAYDEAFPIAEAVDQDLLPAGDIGRPADG
jgi:TIR domain-containing protein